MKKYYRSACRIRIVTSDDAGEKFSIEAKYPSTNKAKKQSARIQSRGIVLHAVDKFPPSPNLKEMSVADFVAKIY